MVALIRKFSKFCSEFIFRLNKKGKVWRGFRYLLNIVLLFNFLVITVHLLAGKRVFDAVKKYFKRK